MHSPTSANSRTPLRSCGLAAVAAKRLSCTSSRLYCRSLSVEVRLTMHTMSRLKGSPVSARVSLSNDHAVSQA
jgi:hypothetical protein